MTQTLPGKVGGEINLLQIKNSKDVDFWHT